MAYHLKLQSKDMLIDVVIEKVQCLVSFFNQYRETGFLHALEAKDIGTTFCKKNNKLKERNILMRIKMTQMLIHNLSGTIIRGTLKAPKSQLVTPISTKLQRPDGCD
jgi:hypothetical protein